MEKEMQKTFQRIKGDVKKQALKKTGSRAALREQDPMAGSLRLYQEGVSPCCL